MTSPKLFEIADTLANLTVLEAKELINILENEYGIKPVLQTVIESKVVEDSKPVVEQTEFDVYLDKIEPYHQKLTIIKTIKELLTTNLKEAKELVEASPCLLRSKLSKAEVEIIRNRLAEFDAKITVK